MAKRAKSADAAAGEAKSGLPKGTGYNGPSAVVITETLTELTRIETEQARLGQQKSTLFKRFEKQGGDPDDLKYVHRLWKLDEAEARAKIERRYRYCAFVGIVQPESHAALGAILEEAKPVVGEAQQQLVGARAYSDGFNSGRAGGAISDCPHQGRPGSIEFVQWRNGWEDGHEEWLKADPARREREQQASALQEDEEQSGAQGAEPEAEEVAPPA